jgi:hypothetical protein
MAIAAAYTRRSAAPAAAAPLRERATSKLEQRHEQRHRPQSGRHHLVGAKSRGEALEVEQFVKRSAREQQGKGAGEQRTNGRIYHGADIINHSPVYHRRTTPLHGFAA